MAKTMADRLWPKVTKTPSCWLWIGPQFSNGYGEIRVQTNGTRRRYLAHRISYELAYGPIPDGLLVLHRCDVRNCIRPEHLFLGTQADNVHDCMAKHRQGNHAPHNPARGEQAGQARFTEAEILSIRREYSAGGIGQDELSKRYGTVQSAIHKIVAGKRWTHLPVANYGVRTQKTYHQAKGEKHGRHKLTQEQAQGIKDAKGTQTAIAKRYGVCRSLVSMIKNGKLWATTLQEHADIP